MRGQGRVLRAIRSDSDWNGIYISSVGRSGVYQAIQKSGVADRIHVVVHDVTPDNIAMIRQGVVDFAIGQNTKTQGTLPLRILYGYLPRRMPEKRVHITEIAVKFRCNLSRNKTVPEAMQLKMTDQCTSYFLFSLAQLYCSKQSIGAIQIAPMLCAMNSLQCRLCFAVQIRTAAA